LQRLHNNGQWALYTDDYAFLLMSVPASSQRQTHWESSIPMTFWLQLMMLLFVNSRTVTGTWAMLKMMTSCLINFYLCMSGMLCPYPYYTLHWPCRNSCDWFIWYSQWNGKLMNSSILSTMRYR
jgi:hypothetical protein